MSSASRGGSVSGDGHGEEVSAPALRAEHDDLAQKLAARGSIDVMRRFSYTAFVALITAGLSVKLAYDRWFSIRPNRFKGPPVYFFIALAITIALLAYAAVLFRRARRIMRGEDALFARMRELRDRLRLDP
jgi:hypothetical protein